MKFKELTGDGLITNIQEKHAQINGHRMWGTVFYEIHPQQDKAMALKQSYKPEEAIAGTFTEYHRQLNNRSDLKDKMQDKLYKNGFGGAFYFNKEAAFKLHISLNDIAELDESIIKGLMELLIEESQSSANNMSFFFKFIDPQNRMYRRFFDTDQLTLYFDKYSSAADLLRLSAKIDDYLLAHGVPKNKIERGPKDHISFNSFVSARFDTNRLLAKYDEYKFFDLELNKFFKMHPIDSLEIPLCAFEAVFNSVLFSDRIKNIEQEGAGLSDVESVFVQDQFKLMLADPKAYLANSEIVVSAERSKRHEQTQSPELIKVRKDLFLKNMEKIDRKIIQLQEEDYPEKAVIADDLYTALIIEFIQLETSPQLPADYSRFRTECTKAILLAKPHLEDHRGWKEVFFNLAIGIATLGAAFLVNYACTNNLFFKLNNDTVNQLNSLKTTVEKMDIPKSSLII